MFKVIIADDEQSVINGLKENTNWESLGLELSGCAASGSDVLSELARDRAHLLITDVRMPGMDGLELITRAKTQYPSLRFIVISAYNNFDYVRKALQLGVENYLLKPINYTELRDTLVKTVENLETDQVAMSRRALANAAFRVNILDRWVNGTIQYFELRERARLLRLDLTAQEYAVCVFDMLGAVPADKRFHKASLLLDICCKTITAPFGEESFIDPSFRVVSILNAESFKGRKDALAAMLRNTVSEAKLHGMNVFASAGSVSSHPANISASHETALLCQAYRYLDASAVCLIYGEPDGKHMKYHQEAFLPDSLLARYEKALGKEDCRQAADRLRELLDSHPEEPVGKLKRIILPYILSLIRTTLHCGHISEALPEKLTAHYSRFTGINSTIALTDWMFKALTDSTNTMRDRKVSLHPHIRKILRHIENNYASDITMKTLAASLDVNPLYLGQLFRRETGKLFNDYLTDVRLDEAKTLLQDTSLKISDIVARIGIHNQSYFDLVFKKKYGLSPVELRRRME